MRETLTFKMYLFGRDFTIYSRLEVKERLEFSIDVIFHFVLSKKDWKPHSGINTVLYYEVRP